MRKKRRQNRTKEEAEEECVCCITHVVFVVGDGEVHVCVEVVVRVVVYVRLKAGRHLLDLTEKTLHGQVVCREEEGAEGRETRKKEEERKGK
jgi:hypothetical protein